MRKQSVLDDIEGFLFRPIKVSTTERWLINSSCFVIGYLIGWQLL
jgi:hypothetical protein